MWHGLASAFFDALDRSGVFGASEQTPLRALQRRLSGLQADPVALDRAADAVLAGRAAPDTATAPFIYAALQVLWTAQTSELRERDVPPVEPAVVCPVCGAVPVASVVRIGAASQGYRFLQCGLCATEFHMVRVKCSTCESTGGIFYHGVVGRSESEPADDTVKNTASGASAGPSAGSGINQKRLVSDPSKFSKAESCDECHTYRKIFYQEHDYETEPLADDLASLALDMLMADAGYERAGANPLLWLDEQS
jgi:FdhE protein